MTQIMLTLRAKQDIEDMAHRLDTSVTREDIFRTLHLLEQSPDIGKVLFPENKQMLYCYLRLGPYLIVYEFTSQDSIRILRVLYLKHSNIALLFNDKPRKMDTSVENAF